MAFAKKEEAAVANIPPINMVRVVLEVDGINGSPLVIHKFSQKNREEMMAAMSRTKAGKADAKAKGAHASHGKACT